MDFITDALAEGMVVDEILLDFAKSFVLVPHQKLLHKIAVYGVSEKLVSWLRDLFCARKQIVIVADSKLEWSDVISGVPQGSVLGPLLFVL